MTKRLGASLLAVVGLSALSAYLFKRYRDNKFRDSDKLVEDPHLTKSADFMRKMPMKKHENLDLIEKNKGIAKLVVDKYYTSFGNSNNSGYYSVIWCLYNLLRAKNSKLQESFLSKENYKGLDAKKHDFEQDFSNAKAVLARSEKVDKVENLPEDDLKTLAICLRVIVANSMVEKDGDKDKNKGKDKKEKNNDADVEAVLNSDLSKAAPMKRSDLDILSKALPFNCWLLHLTDKRVKKSEFRAAKRDKNEKSEIVYMMQYHGDRFAPIIGE